MLQIPVIGRKTNALVVELEHAVNNDIDIADEVNDPITEISFYIIQDLSHFCIIKLTSKQYLLFKTLFIMWIKGYPMDWTHVKNCEYKYIFIGNQPAYILRYRRCCDLFCFL